MTATILKVASTSSPASVAGAIAGVVRRVGTVELQAIGAGAINQAVKAIAIARQYFSPEGRDLVCSPSFVVLVVDGNERTAIRFMVRSIRFETAAA